jgi:hypothetical protein
LRIWPENGALLECELGQREKLVRLEWELSPGAFVLGDGLVVPYGSVQVNKGVNFAEFYVECGKEFRWSLTATNGRETVTAQQMFRLVYPDTTGPTAPPLRSPINESKLCYGESVEVTLSWDEPRGDPSGIDWYELAYRRQSEGWQQRRVESTQWSISVSCGDSYEWRVRAVDRKGNWGEWSQSGVFSTKLPVPRLRSPENGASLNCPNGYKRPVDLIWDSVANNPSYEVELYKYYDRNDWTKVETDQMSKNRYTTKDLECGFNYAWRVRVVYGWLLNVIKGEWSDYYEFGLQD